MKRDALCIVVALAFATGVAVANNNLRPLLKPPLWVDPDDKDIEEPNERDVSELYDRMRNMWLRHIDLGYTARRMSNRPSLNVNAWDEVPDSTWFTNRIGRRSIMPQELLEGPPGRSNLSMKRCPDAS